MTNSYGHYHSVLALEGNPQLLPNIFSPQLRMFGNKRSHQLNTFRVIKHKKIYTVAEEQNVGAEKVPVLSDYYPLNAIEQRRAGTHDAGTERAHQRELRPVATTACVSHTHDLCVRRGVAGLHAQVMAAGHDAPTRIRQN